MPSASGSVGTTYARFEERFATIEGRLGIGATAVVAGAALLALAAIYITPAPSCLHHGVDYARLATRPFDLDRPNPMQLRILSPAIAHFLFLRGRAFIFFPLLTAWIFLAMTYVLSRRRGLTAVESLGMAALMASSTTILFTLHFPGYTDTLSYLLLLLSLSTLGTVRAPAYFAAALLNHESSAFAAPGLVLLGLSQASTRRARCTVIIQFLVAFLPWFAYRTFVVANTPIFLDAGHYLSVANILFTTRLVAKYFLLGLFESFKLFWIFPLIGLAHALRRQRYAGAAWFVVVPVAAAAQMLFAFDTSRLMGLAFPCILLGALAARARMGAAAFGPWLWKLIGLNLLVPTYHVGGELITPLFPLPLSLLLWAFGVDPWTLWW